MSDVSMTVASSMVHLDNGLGALAISVTNAAPVSRRIVLGAFPPRAPEGDARSRQGQGAPEDLAADSRPDAAGWTRIERPVREIPPGGTEYYAVQFLGDRARPGTHVVTFVAYPADRSAEDFLDEGQSVEVLVPASAVPPTPDRRRWWTAAAVVLLLSIGAAAYLFSRPSTLIVPGVVGESRTDAEASLLAADLEVDLEFEVGPEPLDTVIRQTPEEGTEVRAGTAVMLVVRVGVVLPDVVGLPRDEAVAELGDAVTVVEVPQESDEDPGTVLLTQPAAGTEVGTGSTVRVFVASERLVLVPGVVGLEVDDARDVLGRAGLATRVAEGPLCTLPFGGACRIFLQDPTPGNRVPRGSLVTVTTA